ncbi:hypothetical protein CERSUDRAFT_116175 [Gelatoporia subvermispora B]|uniref:AMP-dependent synthetase/ligase domain-containing protein n=1 Tax=Ceriporiopsis subvermispora (strain B) TaxID=914234 RepID=M2RAE2_CERS8|nr:hypothetical protein CERSUDRAFT_116175 [Gelatoporia subvermispora B]
MSLNTHLTVLASSASRYSSSPAFRTPVLDSDGQVREWSTITYSQFQSDVEVYARYWAHTLKADGIPQRSVVAIWVGGMVYNDWCHIYGIARAGYIPQLFSLRLPNPDLIYEIMQKANAQALLYEPSYDSMLTSSPFSIHATIDIRGRDLGSLPLPPLFKPSSPSDIVMIFHTSGSTSGCPKLVPCNYQWLDTMISKAREISKPLSPGRQDVTNCIGSMCHIGQTFMLLGSLQHGACTIQPTRMDFGTEELVNMVICCRLNRLQQWPAFLATHMRHSRQNPKILALLSGLDEIFYSGQAMPRDDEEWAYKHNMQLRSCFGSTECGAMLLSIIGGGVPNPTLRPMPGTKYGFFPIESKPETDAEYENANARLLELVILADSPDCPDISLRKADGHFHTGDLFLEVAPGEYAPRGRDDDWIKSYNSLRCDTKAIEDNVRMTCGDLVANCIVVGNCRPSPALFIEPRAPMDAAKLKKEILRKTRHFHSRRYLHERITAAELIFVVPVNTLPRTATKGNIRRKAVEDAFKEELDRVYATLA